MKLGDLNARQQCALRSLAKRTDAAFPSTRDTHWRVPRNTAYAFAVHDDLAAQGHGYTGRGDYRSLAKSAANTLKALKRRGLATSDSGGMYVQAQWWITPAGLQLLGDADEEATP